jgi:hypothetical protein
MIEDATKPVIEPFELYSDYELNAETYMSVERSGEPVALNLKDAAFALGKSMRALERSLSGKWGNKLPEGWTARKVIVDNNEEWQITPPTGFNLQALNEHNRESEPKVVETDRNGTRETAPSTTRQIISKAASKFAFAKPMMELHLLRELAAAHKELSDERRAHLEDLRQLSELQSSMRLLQTNAVETAKLKEELIEAQKDLIALKNQYQEVLNMPWWKRIFISKPQP